MSSYSRATQVQSHYFYDTLKQLVTSGKLPLDHPLLHCPLDPFTSGSSSAERRAVAELNRAVGPCWAYDLRRLYYGYVCSGRRVSALRSGLVYLCMYDDELRQLLHSHEDEGIIVLPALQLWDEQAERRFYERIKAMDRKLA